MDWQSAFGVALGAGFVMSILDGAALARVPRNKRLVGFDDPAFWFKFVGHPLAGAYLAAVVAATRPMMTAEEAAFIGAAGPTLWRFVARAAGPIVGHLVKVLEEEKNERGDAG